MSASAELSSPVVSSVENPEPLCSICLEEVSATCGRTIVTLQCSHIFHLDCIGSAFNVVGIMQCPNCRQIENGEWLCVETRDSETDMEQNFNQDVEDQEPEMEDHEDHWFPYHDRVIRLPLAADHGIAQVPVPHFFDGSVPVPQNQGGHLTIGPVLQNEIIDLNYQIAVPPNGPFLLQHE
ncbi:hypothetical protein Ddye_021037 [Dipteronia dyeriana]|uniref:RING-type domain-containing protein n=1 Tax=Dipteronia dyeriana TaxID=168575 RepID=A0AAD9WXC3_9ROSI|nr:hypothetical protein Ddye_021037 [Dipteronia dyeriana]